jgi:hypothetical protein
MDIWTKAIIFSANQIVSRLKKSRKTKAIIFSANQFITLTKAIFFSLNRVS